MGATFLRTVHDYASNGNTVDCAVFARAFYNWNGLQRPGEYTFVEGRSS